ncbi:MAG: hypothetical protein R6W90_17030 [Ignavibacteriaceae bacterium]
MNLTRLYIIQSITAASNNLRLSTQKIEVVALLREFLVKSENLESDIGKMKKVTELSTLAIRLNEIYSYLNQGHLDFFKISEKFKEHSQYLIKDLSHMLDMVSPQSLKQALEKISKEVKATQSIPVTMEVNKQQAIPVDLSKRKADEDVFRKTESDKIKEKMIMEDEKEDDEEFFQNFENSVLKPIKPIDALLKQLSKNEVNYEELNNFADIMKKNGQLSAKIGFDILANMHSIIARSLLLIKTQDLMPGREIIESVRACLIVIVAVVRGKEVDITNYLNRAEEFGRKIQNIKVKE